LLAQLLDASHQQKDENAVRIFEKHHALLRRCREAGIEQAFAEIFPSPSGRGAGGEGPHAFRDDLGRAQDAERHYLRTGDLQALDEAAAAWERIWGNSDFSGADAAFRLAALNYGAITHSRRHDARGNLEDLSKAIAAWELAVAQTPAGSPDLPMYLNNLSSGLRDRYTRTGALGDLEKSIRICEQALAQISPGSRERVAILNNLGAGLRDRYEHTGALGDVEKAIKVCEQAVALTSPGSQERATILNNLGNGFSALYARTGALEDLGQAIKTYEQAVAQTPKSSPEMPRHLSNLGNGLRDRYARTGELEDLEKAIKVCEQAVAQTPPGSPEMPLRLNSLGNGFSVLYARTGALEDLEKAIQRWEQAVAQTPAGSPGLPAYLNNLGNGLRARYARTGSLGVLEQAIKTYEQAVAQTPPDSPEMPARLNNLGTGLRTRYERTGALEDLEEAIQRWEQAVAQTPPRSPEMPGYLSNLSSGLRDRYARTGVLEDLEKAIKAYEQAVAQTPKSSPEMPMFLNNLGSGLRDHYARTGALEDLEKAIKVCERAVAQTPPGSPEMPGYLNNLGTGLRARYARTGDMADLQRAIGVYEQAVAQTPQGSPDLPSRLNNLGTGLRARYARTGDLADLEEALRIHEQAFNFLEGRMADSPVAYKLGQQEGFARVHADLVSVCLLKADAADSGAPEMRRRAMVVTEGTKSRVLTGLVSRGLPPPPGVPPEEARREGSLFTELCGIDEAGLLGRGGTSEDAETRRRRDQRRAEVVDQLRAIWGDWESRGGELADWVALRRGDPPKWDDLLRLAKELGPDTALLSLFTLSDGIALFALRAGWEEPRAVQAQTISGKQNDILRRFLREVHGYDHTDRRGETWDRPLRTLLSDALGHLDGARRIVFAPEAFGHLLPWAVALQRAGWQGSVVTVPALGLLPRMRNRQRQADGGALVVGNPLGDLKFAEEEAKQVAAGLGAKPIIQGQATKAAILAGLSDASIVHLATHAYFHGESPMDSGVLLADDILTAREVMQHRLSADLLVLSACQTGIGGSLGGDELAGLAQAFLYAGARSLLVSLWSVNDPATAALMTAFYAEREAGADKAEALRRAMDYVSSQPQWKHTFFWGAFVLMGDWA